MMLNGLSRAVLCCAVCCGVLCGGGQGYLPANRERRGPVLSKQRKDYAEYLAQYYTADPRGTSALSGGGGSGSDRTDGESPILHQIRVDVPRTAPELKWFQSKPMSLVWAPLLTAPHRSSPHGISPSAVRI
jgi:hypothetical protein